MYSPRILKWLSALGLGAVACGYTTVGSGSGGTDGAGDGEGAALGFVIEGERDLRSCGHSVAGVGDMNGDGFADIVVGVPDRFYAGGMEPEASNGAAYVVFGQASDPQVDLPEGPETFAGFAMIGEGSPDPDDPGHVGGKAGSVVAGAGDVNADGLPDVIVSAPYVGYPWAGRAYVVFGKTDSKAVWLSDIRSGDGGFAIDAEAEGDFVGSVRGAGDVNGDGFEDVVVGASHNDAAGSYAGRAYVVFGKANTASVELADVAAGQGGFAMTGESEDDRAGGPLDGAGDVNGDGLADVVIGARYAEEGAGRAYVVFGRADTSPVELSAVAAGEGGFAITGSAESDLMGNGAAGAGDVDGDGLADVVVGAPGVWDDRNGHAYVILGKEDTSPVSPEDLVAGVGGFVVEPEPQTRTLGRVVAGAGDVNGDGLADIVLGDENARLEHGDGRVYVVFGKQDTEAVQLESVVAGEGGFAIDAADGAWDFGHSVRGAGDVNRDGLADVIVGAPRTAVSGRAYVILHDTLP